MSPYKNIPVKIQLEKLFNAGDLGQSPAKTNDLNCKTCYSCKILLDDIFYGKCKSLFFSGNYCEQSSAY